MFELFPMVPLIFISNQWSVIKEKCRHVELITPNLTNLAHLVIRFRASYFPVLVSSENNSRSTKSYSWSWMTQKAPSQIARTAFTSYRLIDFYKIFLWSFLRRYLGGRRRFLSRYIKFVSILEWIVSLASSTKKILFLYCLSYVLLSWLWHNKMSQFASKSTLASAV